MCGNVIGVFTRLKRINPNIYSVHCIAHRLALFSKESLSTFKNFGHFESSIKSILSYYSNSAKRLNNLIDFQSLLHEESLAPPKFKDIRWLNISNAQNFVYQDYCSIVSSLQKDIRNERDKLLSKIIKIMMKPESVFMLDIMLEITKILSNLILIFQKDNINFMMIEDHISIVKSQFGNYLKSKHFPLADNLIHKLSTLNNIILNSNDIKLEMIEEKNMLILRILDDFDVRISIEVINAFTIFNSNLLKSQLNNENLNEYLNKQIQFLISKFAQEILTNDLKVISMFNRTAFMSECQEFKLLLLYTYSKYNNSIELFYDNFKTQYVNICKLYEISLFIPVSTVICEKGFSVQNFIKNKARSNITDTNTDHVIRIFLERSDIAEVDFESCLLKFKEHKIRRSEYK